MTPPNPTYPAALVMLAMDQRDAALLDAVVHVAERLGVTRVLAAQIYRRDPFPNFLLPTIGAANLGSGAAPELL